MSEAKKAKAVIQQVTCAGHPQPRYRIEQLTDCSRLNIDLQSFCRLGDEISEKQLDTLVDHKQYAITINACQH